MVAGAGAGGAGACVAGARPASGTGKPSAASGVMEGPAGGTPSAGGSVSGSGPAGGWSWGCGTGAAGGAAAGALLPGADGGKAPASGPAGGAPMQAQSSSGSARQAFAVRRKPVRRLPALHSAAMTAPRSRSGTFRGLTLRLAFPAECVREVPVGTRVGHGSTRMQQRPVRVAAYRAPAGVPRLRERRRQGHRTRP
jgi:hypothetical protein